MDLEIDLQKLRSCKLMVGVPLYGGMSAGQFTKSMMDLTAFSQSYGLRVQPFFIFNESLITRARNYIADEFMRSDCTHLIFIDGDIGFSPESVLVLWHYSVEKNLDIVCGPYPKKSISWEKIKAAVDQGKADEDPNVLEDYVGDFVLSVVKSGQHNMNEPIECSEAGTGFMLIQRKVFEDFSKAYPELHYLPDHKRTENFDGSREIVAYFLDVIDNKRHLSEDYMFCHWSRKIGKKVWIVPGIKLEHVGSYSFKGDLLKIVAAKQAVTVDEGNLRKK